VEAIAPGETGLVVRENDPDDAAGAIIALFSDRKLLSEMGNRARQRALMNQSWSASMNKYEQAFLSTPRRKMMHSQSEAGVAAQTLGKCGS
jgi:glycosyltransferase involved in cell wall biosynthesis